MEKFGALMENVTRGGSEGGVEGRLGLIKERLHKSSEGKLVQVYHFVEGRFGSVGKQEMMAEENTETLRGGQHKKNLVVNIIDMLRNFLETSNLTEEEKYRELNLAETKIDDIIGGVSEYWSTIEKYVKRIDSILKSINWAKWLWRAFVVALNYFFPGVASLSFLGSEFANRSANEMSNFEEQQEETDNNKGRIRKLILSTVKDFAASSNTSEEEKLKKLEKFTQELEGLASRKK